MSCLPCVSCDPSPPTNRAERPIIVSPATIVRVYRDTPRLAENAYTGQKIRVYLPAKGYTVLPNVVMWSTGLPGSPPVIFFEASNVPPNNSLPIEVVGVCQGVVKDGRHREAGVDWYVLVSPSEVNPPATP